MTLYITITVIMSGPMSFMDFIDAVICKYPQSGNWYPGNEWHNSEPGRHPTSESLLGFVLYSS